MRPNRTTLICARCGTPFLVKSNRVTTARYCSNACRGPHQTTPADFWANVDRTGDCWLWMKACRTSGYGVARYRGRQYGAHRIAYELTHGPIPAGLFVCHKCDRPRCCRPDHLFLGTCADNVADKMAKGRHRPPRGEQCGMAKLTAEQVRAIRARRADGGVTLVQLAQEYGVNARTISKIVRGERWAHID